MRLLTGRLSNDAGVPVKLLTRTGSVTCVDKLDRQCGDEYGCRKPETRPLAHCAGEH